VRAGGFHHLAIKTRDVLGLVEFYAAVLGLEEERRFTDERGLRSVWLALPPGRLMIERAERADVPALEDRPGLHLLALRIEELEPWRRHLGARVEHETKYTLYVRDPDGNRVGLSTLVNLD